MRQQGGTTTISSEPPVSATPVSALVLRLFFFLVYDLHFRRVDDDFTIFLLCLVVLRNLWHGNRYDARSFSTGLELHCNERFSSDSKAAQDQSWRRKTVRSAPRR